MSVQYCVFTEPQQGFTYAQQAASAQETERWGFDGWFRSDHYLAMGEVDPLPGPTDAWTTLAGLARDTERVRLGTLVSPVTFRHPGILAVQVAQVDDMSNGRVELGLGAGWFEREHRAYGIPYPTRRFDLLEEQLQIVTGLWLTPEGSTFSHPGPTWPIEASPALPKPRQDRVPIIMGGGGATRTPALAARYASEFNTGFETDEVIGARFARVRTACEAIGRDPLTLRLSAVLTTFAGASEAEVRERARKAGHDPESLHNGRTIAGGRDEIVKRVEGLVALGAQRIYLQLTDLSDLEQVEFLGSEVLPHLPR